MTQESIRGDASRTRTGASADPGPSGAWTVLSHLLSGILVFGGLGWGLDALLGTRWILLIGLLVGGAASFTLIYIRYVYDPPTPPDHPTSPGRGAPAAPRDRKETG